MYNKKKKKALRMAEQNEFEFESRVTELIGEYGFDKATGTPSHLLASYLCTVLSGLVFMAADECDEAGGIH